MSHGMPALAGVMGDMAGQVVALPSEPRNGRSGGGATQRRQVCCRASALIVPALDSRRNGCESVMPEEMLNLLPSGSVARIAVIGGVGTLARANALAEMLPSVEIVVWDDSDGAPHLPTNVTAHGTEGVREKLETLAAGGEVQAIIDATGDRTTFKNLFFALPAGGRYVLENARTSTVARYVATVLGPRLGGARLNGDDEHVSRSIASVRFSGDACAIEKAGNHLYKVRDERANRIFAGSAHGHRFKVLTSIPGGEFESRARVQTNNEALDEERHPRAVSYPELSLRSYEDVSCYPGQVYRMGGLLLPDTFRRIRAHRLSSRAIQDAVQWFAQSAPAPQVALDGAYYALDSEVPGHFGHFITEILARVWGWDEAKASYPDVKALISAVPGKTDLQAWQYTLLEAAGIRSSDVCVTTEAVRVERLIAATPMFSNPKFVHPEATRIWRNIGRILADTHLGHDRVFISRKPQIGRGCTNANEVERYFRSEGFTVIYPEDHSIGEQISLVDNAEVIAGFAGSGMFSLMFAQTPKRVIVIGSESYDAVNEYLILAAAGGDLTYLWCEPRIPMGDQWTLKSFQSDYRFDFQRDGALLDASLEAPS